MIKVLLAALIGTVIGIGAMVIVIVVAGTDTSGASSVGLASTAPAVSAPSTSVPSPSGSSGATSGGGSSAAGGADAAQIFQDKGCGGCHTFQPAGANGQQGPDLDNVAQDAQKAGKPVDAYVKESIEDPSAYVVPGFQPIMPTFADLSGDQVDALVAYITQSK
jgi:cytochrome c551/c552